MTVHLDLPPDVARKTGFSPNDYLLQRVLQQKSSNGGPEDAEMRRTRAAAGARIYDAAYLNLAIQEGLPLDSLDGQLMTADEKSGVPLFQP